MDQATRYKLIQYVRLADVFLVAPYLMYLSTKVEPGFNRNILALMATGVFLFNGYNYLQDRERLAN